MKRFHMIAEGKVQGVYFRAYTEKLANSLGLIGWVMNKEDGTVEIEAQGTDDVLNQFIEKIKAGPSPKSEVTNLQLLEIEVKDQENNFIIK